MFLAGVERGQLAREAAAKSTVASPSMSSAVSTPAPVSKSMAEVNMHGRTPEEHQRFAMSSYNRWLLVSKTDDVREAVQSWEKNFPGAPLPSVQTLEDHRVVYVLQNYETNKNSEKTL